MTTSSRRYLVIGVIGLIALIAAVIYERVSLGSSQNTDTDSLPKILTIGYNIQSLDTVPLMIAHQNGYFSDEGIDVQLAQVQGSEGAVAIGSGQVDLVIIGAPRLFGPIEKGAPIKMLSPMSNTFQELFVRPNSGITSLEDLEGKNVSYGIGGGAKELFLRNVLEKEDVEIDKINFIDIENIYLPLALMDQMTIDVALISDSNFVDEAEKLGAVVLPEWQAKDYHNLPIGLTVAVNTDFLTGNEETVSGFFKAIIEAHRYLQDNPDESAAIIAEFIKVNTNSAIDISPNEFLNLLNEGRVSYVLWEDPKYVVEMAKISYEMGQLGRILSQDDLYDFRFQDLLESAQHEIYGTATN